MKGSMRFTIRKTKTTRYIIAACVLMGVKLIDAISGAYDKNGNKKDQSEISFPVPNILKENGSSSNGRSFLRVMTLNIAHGRKNGRHQFFRRTSTIKSNLDDISSVLREKQPDVVALQEADGPSAWSGNFDHVHYIAERSDYAYSVRGEHVKRKNTSYGTALLSSLPLNTPVSVKFPPSPPTFPKGLIISTVTVPGDPPLEVDIASVHLDFSRQSVREKQVDEIVDRFQHRESPLILMGDFNCEWKTKESTLQNLAERLDLKAYRPHAGDLVTFPKSSRRLDWILVSPEFEFITYDIVNDIVSDHRGVITDLRVTVSGDHAF
jgi:endonuclease/exonuclease/phosphatase family metal-dependent hydrolase